MAEDIEEEPLKHKVEEVGLKASKEEKEEAEEGGRMILARQPSRVAVAQVR